MRRSVSGLMKILHPHGEVSSDDLEEILDLAIEGRRRVKEQLKKMGSFEYYQTSFSYLVNETGRSDSLASPSKEGVMSSRPIRSLLARSTRPRSAVTAQSGSTGSRSRSRTGRAS